MKYEDFRATFVEAIEVFTAQVYNTGEMLIRDDRGSQAKPQCGILGNKNSIPVIGYLPGLLSHIDATVTNT